MARFGSPTKTPEKRGITHEEGTCREVHDLGDSDAEELRRIVARHHAFTDSAVATRLLARWDEAVGEFVVVMPNDFKRVLTVMRDAEAEGLPETETFQRVMEAAHG